MVLEEDDGQAVKECYKEYIGVENTMREQRDRSRKGQAREVAENSSGTMELQGRLHEMMSRWKAIRTKRIPRGLQDFVEEDLEFEIKENNNEKRLVVWNKTENNKGVPRARFKTEEIVSDSNLRSEMKEYARYVLQIQDDAKLSERISRNALKSINQLLSKSEKNEPGNLIKLLKKSTAFKGVLEFDNDQVPPLHSEENQNSWSLVVVTLTAIVVALPNTSDDHGEGLIASMREGLQIVRNIEECLNANSDLVNTRRAARRVWTQVEVYRKWLQIDLQKKAHDRRTSKEILEWLRDEAVKIVIQFKSCKRRRMDDSHYKFIVASSMYRISQTILIHCSELENWPLDGQLLEWISNMIADILCACFTNLPCVIKMMCHHDVIEKREDSVRSAAW
nr:hypothetical protein CTI12_AA045380 [Tanacetum cinerariifolium]